MGGNVEPEAVSLKDNIAVVTGASRGIGRAIALDLARKGVDIVCAARSTEEAPSKLPGTIEETASLIRALGRRAIAVPCNILDDQQVEALVRRTLEEFGRVDILVNNAGVSPHMSFLETPMKRWDLVMNVNLRGSVLCAKAFLPQMVEQGSGHIINVSSGAAANPAGASKVGVYLAYPVSKVAVEAFTEGLAAETEAYGISVNCLRVDMLIASEGVAFLLPQDDLANVEKPEAASEATVWIATRPKPYTGRIVSITEIREAMDREARLG